MPIVKTKLWLISLVVLSLSSFFPVLAGVARSADAADWTLEQQVDGIDVYTRSVPGSPIKAFKGEGIVGVDVEAIVSLLRETSRFKEWFPNTSASRLLRREGNVSYQYLIMKTPWPISDRDNVLRAVTTRDAATGRVEIALKAAPKAYPLQDGLHRVTRAAGSWELTPAGPGKTFVLFSMHLEPGGGLPDWLVNARIVANPHEALINLRKILGVSAIH